MIPPIIRNKLSFSGRTGQTNTILTITLSNFRKHKISDIQQKKSLYDKLIGFARIRKASRPSADKSSEGHCSLAVLESVVEGQQTEMTCPLV